MAQDTVESQLQDIREQLDSQAEAISKLAAVVSTLDGIDSALIGSYVRRLKRLHGPIVDAPTSEAPASIPSEPESEAVSAVPH